MTGSDVQEATYGDLAYIFVKRLVEHHLKDVALPPELFRSVLIELHRGYAEGTLSGIPGNPRVLLRGIESNQQFAILLQDITFDMDGF